MRAVYRYTPDICETTMTASCNINPAPRKLCCFSVLHQHFTPSPVVANTELRTAVKQDYFLQVSLFDFANTVKGQG